MSIEIKDLKLVKFETTKEIGTITINRPDKLNALNIDVLLELRLILDEIFKERSFSLKGLILKGAGGKAFIAGADIEQMTDMSEKDAWAFGKLGQRVTLLLETLKIPVIAAVNGFALGGGCELAMGCDFILATEKSIFGQPETKLGLIPGFGGTQRLARYIGRHKAREIIYTGRSFTAEEAFRLGLIHSLYKNEEDLLEECFNIFDLIKKNSPLAISVVKKVMNMGIDRELPESLTLELEEFSTLFNSFDLVEGTKAFIEKRSPQFKGE